MNKYKAPKPQPPRTKSLPVLKIRESPKKTSFYSKAALKHIKERSIPSHDFCIQSKPKKTLKLISQSILTTPAHLPKLRPPTLTLPLTLPHSPTPHPSYFYFCNIRLNHKSPSLPMTDLYIHSNPVFFPPPNPSFPLSKSSLS